MELQEEVAYIIGAVSLYQLKSNKKYRTLQKNVE